MRVWVAADAELVRALREGAALTGERIAAESEDEAHEHEALLAAAERGPVVVVAEVGEDDALTLDVVHAFHVDADGSGDLAWYATQEIGDVIAAVS
ncbi:hypothetical protein ACHAAC_12080 [Aeromicrobium sp. CF4.19]|uniref:hypothetical protein n=1 Tax=Aeromicrobium sp. CF4.19 TaxID=3373082 RepID=UPI003EE51F34